MHILGFNGAVFQLLISHQAVKEKNNSIKSLYGSAVSNCPKFFIFIKLHQMGAPTRNTFLDVCSISFFLFFPHVFVSVTQ